MITFLLFGMGFYQLMEGHLFTGVLLCLIAAAL